MTTPLKPSPIRLVTHSDGSLHPHHLNGWRRDATDDRDFRISAHEGHRLLTAPVATKSDLRPKASPVRNQLSLGSCVAHGVSAPVEMNELAYDSHTLKQMSTLFQYQMTLTDNGEFGQDNGSSIRDGIKAIVKHGALLEGDYPYDITKFKVKPSKKLQTTAAKHKVTSYHRIADGDLHSIKAVLSSGYMVVFGFNVPASFETQEFASDPILRHRDFAGQEIVGGHCVVICGHADSNSLFTIRNSWSKGWGDQGYAYFDYDFVADSSICSDFQIIESAPL